jgi:UDP-glucuronate 4-epimerase
LIELIKLIEGAFGKKANIEMLETQPGDVSITYADISKAKRMLGYQPKVKMKEGIRRFVEWYKAQSA